MFVAEKFPLASVPVMGPVGVVALNRGTTIGPAESGTPV